MHLEELRALMAVADSGSFVAAASTLSMSRTTLRRQVDSLESRTGVPLLLRNRRGVKLTEAGNRVVRQGRRLLAEAAYLLESVRDMQGVPAGDLRLIVPPGAPMQGLLAFLTAFRNKFPRVQLLLSMAADPTEALPGGVDIVVHYGVAPPGPWESLELLSLRVWLIAGEDYLKSHPEPISANDLRDHTLFAWQPPSRDPRVLPLRQGGSIRVEPVMITPDVHLLHQLALAGDGIVFTPDGMLPNQHGTQGTVVPVLRHLVGEKQKLHMTVPHALRDVPAVKVVVDAIRTALQLPPPGGSSAQS